MHSAQVGWPQQPGFPIARTLTQGCLRERLSDELGHTPGSFALETGTRGVNVVLSATTAVSASLQQRNSKGVVLASETITVGPVPVSRTFVPPIVDRHRHPVVERAAVEIRFGTMGAHPAE